GGLGGGGPGRGGGGRGGTGAVEQKPPRAGSLFRLGGFARHRAGLIAWGFALTLAGTVAGLVPPYLTMPLIDKVLVPAQSGEPLRAGLLWALLGGLAGAPVLGSAL